MPTSKSRRKKSGKAHGAGGSAKKDFQELLRCHQAVAVFDPIIEAVLEDEEDDLTDEQWSSLFSAEADFANCARALLRANRLQRTLEEAINRGWCSPDDMLAIHFAVRWDMRSWETVEGDASLCALPINGVIPSDLPAPNAVAERVRSCIQADSQAGAVPIDVLVRLAPTPVHPLALSLISLDDQYRLRDELNNAGDGPVWHRLMDVNREILTQIAPKASDEAVLSSRIWIMVITDQRALGPEAPPYSLDSDLEESEFDDDRWADLHELFPVALNVGAPVPLASAATTALLNHTMVGKNLLASSHGLPHEVWDDVEISSVQETAEVLLIGFHHQGDFLGTIQVELDWLFVGERNLIETIVDTLSPDLPDDDDEEHEDAVAPMSGNVLYLADHSANKPSRVH